MTSSTHSDRCVRQKLDIAEESVVSTEESSEESSKTVPFAPVEEAIGKMGPEEEVNFSSFALSSEKDRHTMHSAATRDVSSSETGSGFLKETEVSMRVAATMVETCPASVSVPLMDFEVLETENSGDEVRKMKETGAPNASISEQSSGFSGEGENFDDDKTGFINRVDVASPKIQAFSGYNGEEESLNLEEKGKKPEVQRLLEAEKKRLLALIEVGTIFREKADADAVTSDSGFFGIDKNGNGCQQQQQETVQRMILKDHAFVGGSLKVEVIDDTAVVDVVPIYKKGNDHPRRLETSRADEKNIGEKTVDRNQGKGTRGIGKGKGNAAKVDNKSAQVSEFRDLDEKIGNMSKIMYSRKQMEAMRFAKIADQRKLWSDIYTGLAPEVVSEYEGLASLKNQKNSKPNRDRGQPIPRNRDIGILENNNPEERTGEDLVMEEYYTEGDDSDDDYNSILKPAFEVEGEPDFDSGPPEDGLEYLRRVRWEAKQIPKVKVAKRDRSKYAAKEQTIYMPQLPEIAKCPEHLLPLKEWEDAFLSDFSDLRLALSQLDALNTNSSGESQSGLKSEEEIISCQLAEDLIMEKFKCLKSEEVEATKEYSFEDPLTKPIGKEEILLLDTNPKPRTATCGSFGEHPTLSALQRMDSVTRVSMLRKRISLVEAANSLERSDCMWLFALCAVVDTPLDADTCACLRGLLRKCASIRTGKSEVDDEVIMANILATISGRYFGQMEP